MVKAVLKLKLKLTMALYFFAKKSTTNAWRMGNENRRSKTIWIQKRIEKEIPRQMYWFSLWMPSHLHSMDCFFNCFHFMNLLVMVTGIIIRTLYKAMQHLIPSTENSFLLFSTNHNVKQCAFYFFHALTFSAPWSRDAQLVSFPPSIVLFVCLCSDKNSWGRVNDEVVVHSPWDSVSKKIYFISK